MRFIVLLEFQEDIQNGEDTQNRAADGIHAMAFNADRAEIDGVDALVAIVEKLVGCKSKVHFCILHSGLSVYFLSRPLPLPLSEWPVLP
jgi:hypothetical protein